MGNLGASLYHTMLSQERARQNAWQQQQQLDQAQSERVWAQNMAQARFQMEREQVEFDRQYKLAELHGKLSAQNGARSAPAMRVPELQERADVEFGLERNRPAQMEREAAAKYGYRFGIENMKTDRAKMGIASREGIAAGNNNVKMNIAREKDAREKERINLMHLEHLRMIEMDVYKKQNYDRAWAQQYKKAKEDRAARAQALATAYISGGSRLHNLRGGLSPDGTAIMNRGHELSAKVMQLLMSSDSQSLAAIDQMLFDASHELVSQGLLEDDAPVEGDVDLGYSFE